MLKRSLLLISLLYSFLNTAQENHDSNKSILLRGKASAFVIIEDLYFLNWNLGTEYRFAERHSIGVDDVFFRWRQENDIYIDGIDSGSGPSAYSRRRYFLIDYRFYPFRKLMQQKSIDLYINPFVKIGQRKIWSDDPETYYSDNDGSAILNQGSTFFDYGFALGLHYSFGKKDRIGLDLNIGTVYRETQIQYEQRFDYDNFVLVESTSGNRNQWTMHMRLNLYIKLFKFE